MIKFQPDIQLVSMINFVLDIQGEIHGVVSYLPFGYSMDAPPREAKQALSNLRSDAKTIYSFPTDTIPNPMHYIKPKQAATKQTHHL